MAEIVSTVGTSVAVVGDLGHVSGLQWSTGWPYGFLGASFNIDLPPNTFPRALSPNASVEIWDGPIRVGSGYIAEVDPGEPWSVQIKGWYSALVDLLSLNGSATDTSAVPSVVVAAAIARGPLPISIGSTLPTTSITTADETVNITDGLTFMNAWTEEAGMRWGVDADNVLTVADDPTAFEYVLNTSDPLRGTADDDYVTDVYVRFVATVDPSTGDPATYGLGHVSTASSPAGRRERKMDVTDRGVMTQAAAETLAQGQLELNGARMGYTSGLEFAYGELLRPGGTPARLGHVKAGQMFRSFNVADASGQVQLGMTADVVIGQTTYADGAATLQISPAGMAPRTFVDTLAALKVPESFDGTAA